MSTGVHEEPGPFAAPARAIGPVERAEQRAETMRTLTRLSALDADHPQRARLRAEVIEDHMAYARHLAGHYSRRGVSDEDFAQVAYLGLVKAVDNFDPGRGTGFLGYATPMIIGEIKRYFRDATWDVHVPRRMQEITGALRRAREELTVRQGREPTISQLAEHVGLDADEVVEALDAAEAYSTSSLDRPVGLEEGGATLGETIGHDDPGFRLTEDREVLRGLVAGLSERDKRILLMRFFRGMTQAEIGEELGISQMQVSRLITKVLGQLREGFG
ncbi:SigB/SigF/SigG family RNA polymerase sigma factor [Actinospica robiniae]|uniref:SigB/SigF/SigG family RNA polymerase sigma factor n=1 Tax=Actinospica robiniae TaxID=304901 RepID=UPI0003F97A7D|nr:SigB/SigF/SigG family RNA polymerase sigma factor [Actinospica robiniae]